MLSESLQTLSFVTKVQIAIKERKGKNPENKINIFVYKQIFLLKIIYLTSCSRIALLIIDSLL